MGLLQTSQRSAAGVCERLKICRSPYIHTPDLWSPPTGSVRPSSVPARGRRVYRMKFRSVTKRGGVGGGLRGSTLNVSIKAGGCASWRGREPKAPLHVYLEAPPHTPTRQSFSLVTRIKKT